MKKEILCIVGRSGSGKTTYSRKLKNLGYHEIVSVTTRAMRQGEVEGVDYYYVNAIDQSECIEYATHAGFEYGILKSEIENDATKYCVVVNVEGLTHLEEYFKDNANYEIKRMFIDEAKEVLIERLLKRDAIEVAQKRIDILDDEYARINNVYAKNKADWQCVRFSMCIEELLETYLMETINLWMSSVKEITFTHHDNRQEFFISETMFFTPEHHDAEIDLDIAHLVAEAFIKYLDDTKVSLVAGQEYTYQVSAKSKQPAIVHHGYGMTEFNLDFLIDHKKSSF